MKILRLLGDVILAAVLCVLLVAVVLVVYGRAMAGPWQVTPATQGLVEGQYIWVNQQPLRLNTWGPEDGQPVALVHGFDIGGAAVWSPVATSLGRAGYRVIAVDLPPLGQSARKVKDLSLRGQAETLATVLNEMGAQDAVLVGQGWGGAVALQATLDQPQLARSLVLIGPQLEPGLDRYERMAAGLPLAQESVTWLVRGGGPIWRVLLRRQVAGDSPAFEAYAQTAQEASQIEGTVAALSSCYALDPALNRPVGLGSLSKPVLIVRGEQDRLVTVAQTADLASELDAEVLTVADAGHLVALDQPSVLRQILLEALQP